MKIRQATTVGALLLGSALMAGCVYSQTSGGPEAWGWSGGMRIEPIGSAMVLQIEAPLGDAAREDYIVMSTGGDYEHWTGDSKDCRYKEDFRLGYRHYSGRGAPGSSSVRFFLDAAVSTGTLESGISEDRNSFIVGAGMRWRPDGTSDGPRNMFMDISLQSFSGLGPIGNHVALTCGSSFGRSSGGGLGLSGGMRSAGPRMGMVYVTGEAADQLEAAYGVGPALTTIGWQFEYQYASVENGPTGLVEIIPLVTGLESELSFVSMNVLFGMRSPTEWEFMVGPYISETGHGMTLAVGKTARIGRMAMPVNLGVTGTAEGLRGSLTFGWNIGR